MQEAVRLRSLLSSAPKPRRGQHVNQRVLPVVHSHFTTLKAGNRLRMHRNLHLPLDQPHDLEPMVPRAWKLAQSKSSPALSRMAERRGLKSSPTRASSQRLSSQQVGKRRPGDKRSGPHPPVRARCVRAIGTTWDVGTGCQRVAAQGVELLRSITQTATHGIHGHERQDPARGPARKHFQIELLIHRSMHDGNATPSGQNASRPALHHSTPATSILIVSVSVFTCMCT